MSSLPRGASVPRLFAVFLLGLGPKLPYFRVVLVLRHPRITRAPLLRLPLYLPAALPADVRELCVTAATAAA